MDLEGRSAPDTYAGKVWRYETADKVSGAGMLGVVLGLAFAAATFMAWTEFGRWTEVLTGMACVTGAVLVLGVFLAWFGERKAEQWRARNVSDYRPR